ncbi:hypothetical protein EVAR_30507_1 [Eumeta japonica]|uniref:Uncharacterized protein n=1 Tax=Eumeta variegata TaxID=151549 RepID=A0A4C1VY05_EUMVA|nr:hypothetical protein EVAR_30507_1 [Eumeta japonica]
MQTSISTNVSEALKLPTDALPTISPDAWSSHLVKAYDRVKRNILWRTLSMHEVSSGFIQACGPQEMINKMNDSVKKRGKKVNFGKTKLMVFERSESRAFA